MKSLFRRLKGWFSRRSMRTKLTVTFTGTVVFILLMMMVFLGRFLVKSYREQMMSAGDKACDQACSFLERHLSAMVYVSDLIYYNNEIQDTLSSPGFSGDRSFGEQYREFLRLDNIFTSAEDEESVYRARVFIPDSIFYSYNQKHFAGLSLLEAREDYPEFLKRSKKAMVYFAVPEDWVPPGQKTPVNLLSLFRAIRPSTGLPVVIGVEEISIETARLQDVLDKSDITSSGAVYLMDSRDRVLCVSEGGRDLLERLRMDGVSLKGDPEQERWVSQELDGELYYVNQKVLTTADWTLVALLPEQEVRQQAARVNMVVFLLTVAAAALVSVLSALLARYYTIRLERLTKLMHGVGGADPGEETEQPEGDEIEQLFQNFSRMTEEIQRLMEERYASGQAVKNAQLTALQALINPHFLYNTLDLINWEAIDHDAPEIARVAQNLARYYRISLNRGRYLVTIGQELSHVKAYVEIENLHFDGAITMTVDAPEDLLELGCINIILQPLVENSIVHGMGEQDAFSECVIAVTVRRDGDDLLLTVEDDGVGMDEKRLSSLLSTDPTESHGYGVKNVDQRLKISYGEGYGLSFESWPGKGTRATIRIPALSLEELEERLS